MPYGVHSGAMTRGQEGSDPCFKIVNQLDMFEQLVLEQRQYRA